MSLTNTTCKDSKSPHPPLYKVLSVFTTLSPFLSLIIFSIKQISHTKNIYDMKCGELLGPPLLDCDSDWGTTMGCYGVCEFTKWVTMKDWWPKGWATCNQTYPKKISSQFPTQTHSPTLHSYSTIPSPISSSPRLRVLIVVDCDMVLLISLNLWSPYPTSTVWSKGENWKLIMIPGHNINCYRQLKLLIFVLEERLFLGTIKLILESFGYMVLSTAYIACQALLINRINVEWI